MMNRQLGQAVALAVACLLGALVLISLPGPSEAVVMCPPPSSLVDTDGDGLSDAQECAGITFADGTTLPRCVPGSVRADCVDPDTKDAFLLIVPAASGSLLPSPIPQPGFDPYALFSPLGVTMHKVTPSQVTADRTLNFPGSVQKAIRATESLDINGTVLGFCNLGTPLGLDGCVIYTQRIINFINTTCDSARDTTTNRQAIFRNYVLQTLVHESGHSAGGMTRLYDAAAGGNHYKTGSGTIMDQSVSYTAKGGKCTFGTTSVWNLTLDPGSVILK